jgi:hypothetical protein
MTAVWVALAAAIPGLAAAVIGVFNRSKLAEVHVLVNSKMSEALNTIASLRIEAANRAALDATAAKADVVAATIASRNIPE